MIKNFWTCPNCNAQNPMVRTTCEVCDHEKPKEPTSTKKKRPTTTKKTSESPITNFRIPPHFPGYGEESFLVTDISITISCKGIINQKPIPINFNNGSCTVKAGEEVFISVYVESGYEISDVGDISYLPCYLNGQIMSRTLGNFYFARRIIYNDTELTVSCGSKTRTLFVKVSSGGSSGGGGCLSLVLGLIIGFGSLIMAIVF